MSTNTETHSASGSGKNEVLKLSPIDYNLVYFDFETTGLSPYAEEIVQIAAESDSASFDSYILPSKQINPHASKVTGLSIEVSESDGQRRLIRTTDNGDGNKIEELKTLDLKEALENFLDYLTTIPSPIVLIGHNVNNFDTPFLFTNLEEVGLIERLFEIVTGVIDTLVVFKKVYPKLEGGYPQGKLYEKFVGDKFDAHNAMGDVAALKKLVQAAKISNDQLVEFGFTCTRKMYEKFVERRTQKLLNKDLAKLKI